MEAGSKVYVVLDRKYVASGIIEAINDPSVVCHFCPCENGFAILESFTVDKNFEDVNLPRPTGGLVKVGNLRNSRYMFSLDEISIIPPGPAARGIGMFSLRSKPSSSSRDVEDLTLEAEENETDIVDDGDGDDESDEISDNDCVLDLKKPEKSKLMKKRKIRSNPERKNKNGKRARLTPEPDVSVHDRVREFPNEGLECRRRNLNNGGTRNELFCTFCCKVLASLKKTSISSHCDGKGHKEKKEDMQLKKNNQQVDILKYVNEMEDAPRGSVKKDPESLIWSLQVLTGVMTAGIPISKIDEMGDIFKKNNYAIPHSSNLRDFIPAIHEKELALIMEELKDLPFSIIFDGTTHFTETYVVIVRFVDSSARIQQRLCSLQLLEKSLTGEECASLLIEVIVEILKLSPSKVIAAMRDRASVNDKAINLLNVFYKNMMDSPCLAHTYNNVGERFHVPILKRFEEAMNSAIKLSAAACRKFRQIVGKSPITGTRNRWWSRWEAYALVQEKFEKIQEWITACQDLDICKNSMLALTEIVFADQSRDKLMIELGVIVDLGKRFVQSTSYTSYPAGSQCYSSWK
jgi:hypothetical protein